MFGNFDYFELSMKKACPYMIELQNLCFVKFEMSYNCIVIVLKIIFSANGRGGSRYKLPDPSVFHKILYFCVVSLFVHCNN